MFDVVRLRCIILLYLVSSCLISCSRSKPDNNSDLLLKNKDREVVLIFGPPASGKGYISHLMQERFGYKHVSTGDILRSKTNDNVKKSMSSGKMVNDEIILSMLNRYLMDRNSEKKIILDGFPRNKHQLKITEDFLSNLHFKINSIILINCTKDKLLSGLKTRQQSSAIKRSDDNTEIFLQRLNLYEEFLKGDDGLENFIKNLKVKNEIIKVIEIGCHSKGISDILDLQKFHINKND